MILGTIELSAPDKNVCSRNSTIEFNYVFQKHHGLKWLAMLVIAVLYAIPIYKVYVRKSSPEMTPRSPNMIIMYLCFLLLDSIMNTYLFSMNNPEERTVLVCYLGVFCTVVCQFGIMMMVYLRMYRIYSVFSAYEEYLKW